MSHAEACQLPATRAIAHPDQNWLYLVPKKKDWWVDLGWLPDIHLDAFSPPLLNWTGGENKIKKLLKGQRQFNKKSKSCARNQSKKRNAFPASHQQADAQLLPGKQSLSTRKGGLEEKHHNPSFPELSLKEMCSLSFVCCLLCGLHQRAGKRDLLSPRQGPCSEGVSYLMCVLGAGVCLCSPAGLCWKEI